MCIVQCSVCIVHVVCTVKSHNIYYVFLCIKCTMWTFTNCRMNCHAHVVNVPHPSFPINGSTFYWQISWSTRNNTEISRQDISEFILYRSIQLTEKPLTNWIVLHLFYEITLLLNRSNFGVALNLIFFFFSSYIFSKTHLWLVVIICIEYWMEMDTECAI